MSHSLVSKLPEADMQAAPAALLRVGERAREVARLTNTAVVVMRNGQLIEEREPAQLSLRTPTEPASGGA